MIVGAILFGLGLAVGWYLRPEPGPPVLAVKDEEKKDTYADYRDPITNRYSRRVGQATKSGRQ